jgi:uncharacterized membrane protein
MFPTTVAQWHAALNDFPSILLLLSVAFDLAGGATKRESLKAAAFWTLVIGAAGAILALVSGLIAEEAIEHTERMEQIIERHELLAISLTVLFVGLAGWRIWRRGNLGPAERPVYLMVAGVGAIFLLWTAHLGGTIVFEHGGGIPTTVMEEALKDRPGEQLQEPDEEEYEEAGGTGVETESASGQGDEIEPSVTPAHER